MANNQNHRETLLQCISLEMKEQENRYNLESGVGLKDLRLQGVALHPISVIGKSFGYADYPEIEFKLPYINDTRLFKDNSAIECFVDGEDPVKGVFLGMNGKKGSFRLFAPDFPDWIEDKGVGIKLAPDHHTSEQMTAGVKNLENYPLLKKLFDQVHGQEPFGSDAAAGTVESFKNQDLNESQRKAVEGMVSNDGLLIVHGPPGTGKTITLIEGVIQQIQRGKKLIVTAPSNAAVDHFANGLIDQEVNILRVGNTLKVGDGILPYTSEGAMQQAKEAKEIKRLKIQAEEFRKMAMQYKRRFGKEERAQRSLLMKEVKRIRKEIRAIRDYFDTKLFEKADVILGTPVGLKNFLKEEAEFDTLIMDESGQALEPLAWMLFPHAKSWILAGDPFQLPPTVLSKEAERLGFNISILERSFKNCRNIYFLDTQYRMRKSIAEFSSRFFYDGALKTPDSQSDDGGHLTFFDTAGTGFEEQQGQDGASLMNEGEIDIIEKLIELEGLNPASVALISPYAGQIQLAKDRLHDKLRKSTIDSFQGQEGQVIIVSLVRSNVDATIGFLQDYRRMNVALTRAKERLFVIGDSSTIGQDKFYASFLEYIESIEGYRSAWELMG